ncbi:SDR family oxidoreductase [Cohnella cholangitidis]|uniref:SDR family oxidoreductase n=1 Tax=Cohnella cholangitidis TaxID=2598458 RepID=A0A7G5BY85_9BACL|nr:SDR family oxidoreductase [Cohnella cholangitidis]QMV41919.1 SDR family oxidoreductase [Cohnella cholangitidis]
MDTNVKIALVTGANKGIGFEICRQLGERGITVLVGARDDRKGKEAADKLVAQGIDAHFVKLDVTDQPTIDQAFSHILTTYGRLDILVNNAGIFLPEGAPSDLDIETMKEVYETNVFGVFRVTKAMLPLLRRSASGRIVNMSSSLGSLSLNSDPNFELASFLLLGYNSSKTAVNALTVFFANELKDTSIKVSSADPGYCSTSMTNFSGSRSPQEGAQTAVRLATLPDDESTGGFYNDNGKLAW